MKLINPIQKCPHIIDICLYSINICLNIFIPDEFLISFEKCATPKLSKNVTFTLAFTYNAIQWVPIDYVH